MFSAALLQQMSICMVLITHKSVNNVLQVQ